MSLPPELIELAITHNLAKDQRLLVLSKTSSDLHRYCTFPNNELSSADPSAVSQMFDETWESLTQDGQSFSRAEQLPITKFIGFYTTTHLHQDANGRVHIKQIVPEPVQSHMGLG